MAAATLERHADVIMRSVPEGYVDEGDTATYHQRAERLRKDAAAIRAAIASKQVCTFKTSSGMIYSIYPHLCFHVFCF